MRLCSLLSNAPEGKRSEVKIEVLLSIINIRIKKEVNLTSASSNLGLRTSTVINHTRVYFEPLIWTKRWERSIV
jgi:hypothetical protein